MNLYFTNESRNTLKSFSLFLFVTNITKYSTKKFQKLVLFIICRGSTQSLVYTLLFYRARGRHRNVTRIIMHVHCIVPLIKPFILWRSRCRFFNSLMHSRLRLRACIAPNVLVKKYCGMLCYALFKPFITPSYFPCIIFHLPS